MPNFSAPGEKLAASTDSTPANDGFAVKNAPGRAFIVLPNAAPRTFIRVPGVSQLDERQERMYAALYRHYIGFLCGKNTGDAFLTWMIKVTDSYSIEKQNKIKQLATKAKYDRDTVYQILDAGLVAHAAFVQDGNPIVVPMIYGREGDTVFLHGARKARVIRLLEKTNKICLNVTLLDGIVVARSTFNSSMNYRSVTVFGTPEFVEGKEQKLHAMKIISEHTIPGRWDEVRDSHDKEIKMTGVIALQIDSGSAKISAGPPDDDEEDYAIAVWAGVLPITSIVQTLQSDDRLLPGAEPSAAMLALQNRKL